MSKVSLSSLLELVHLLHLEMLHAAYMLHEKMFTRGRELAQLAVIGHSFAAAVVVLTLLEMLKEQGRDLMLLVVDVDLELVRTVGVEITSIAVKFNWVQAGEEPQLPLIGRSTLLDVVDMA